MNKIKKLLKKLYILIHEKKWKMDNGKEIKYMFFKKKSDELIISFSGFSGQNEKPKYNYVRTLKNCNKNQIYILDNFGYKESGSYYLGENGDYFLEREIPKLISKIKEKYKIKKIYTIGTSKGGWASLYYGILLNGDVSISGAPQYYIGNYLNTTEYHKNILNSIIKDNSEIETLNNKLSNLIKQKDISNIKFIVHYSKSEHTYDEHIKYLINDLKEKKCGYY